MTESLSELIARSFAVSNNRIKKLEAELAALKAGAGEPVAPEGWQPIETAPKDGTKVLLWDGDVCTGEWYSNVHPWNNGDWWINGGEVTTKTATHWMPLPEPPSADPQ